MCIYLVNGVNWTLTTCKHSVKCTAIEFDFIDILSNKKKYVNFKVIHRNLTTILPNKREVYNAKIPPKMFFSCKKLNKKNYKKNIVLLIAWDDIFPRRKL